MYVLKSANSSSCMSMYWSAKIVQYVLVSVVQSRSLNHVTSVAVNHVSRKQRDGDRACAKRSTVSGSHPQDVAAVAFGDDGRAAAVVDA